MRERAWIELNSENLRHNLLVLSWLLPAGCSMMAVVKADAYGHSARLVTPYLESLGVRNFAVATLEEGAELRQIGIRGEILILGYTDPCRAQELLAWDLTQTVVGRDHAAALSGYPVKVHIKVDTGMHRLGFDYDDVAGVAACFTRQPWKITGIFSHLGVSDSLDPADAAFTQLQTQRLRTLLLALSERGISLPKVHIHSSYGLLNGAGEDWHYARVGLSLYGVHSLPGMRTLENPRLKPVLSLRARVAQVRCVAAGETVGYGNAFRADRDTRIAVLPIGYADGVPRQLSCGKGHVLLHGSRAPVAGRVCMDQLAVDVTDLPTVRAGDVATLLGDDGAEQITAEEWAQKAQTITNEILSRLGKRLPRYM